MPTAPRKRCTKCRVLHSEDGGKCPDCKAAARRDSDARRGSPAQRGYTAKHRSRFRPGVLEKNPTCVCDADHCDHEGICGEPSTVADHHPRSRRELVAIGWDPDDPANGRGVCEPCHNKHTARNQPGGWHAKKKPAQTLASGLESWG